MPTPENIESYLKAEELLHKTLRERTYDGERYGSDSDGVSGAFELSENLTRQGVSPNNSDYTEVSVWTKKSRTGFFLWRGEAGSERDIDRMFCLEETQALKLG